MIDLKNSKAKEIVVYFSNEINSLTFNPEKIADEQKGNIEMKILDLCWIKKISSSNYRTDLRNESSSMVGKQLASIPFIRKQIESINNEKMLQTAEKMAQEHRTLQQIFSGLVFCHFINICNKKEKQILFDIMGDSFFKLPLI